MSTVAWHWFLTFYLSKAWHQPTLLKSVQSESVMHRVYSSFSHCCYGTEGSQPDRPNADVTSLMCTAKRRREGGEERRTGEYKVIGLPAPFSMTHHENKSAGGLNYHIHLNRALSSVVLEKDPNQQHSLWLTALLTTMSVTALWINK